MLEEQVATLEQENTVLKTENANPKQKIKDFEQQVSGSHPKDELQPEAVQILKLLFNGDSVSYADHVCARDSKRNSRVSS